MTKALILVFSATFTLSACAEEAAAPVQDEVIAEESLPNDVAPPDTMPDGVVQDEAATLPAPSDLLPGEELESDAGGVTQDRRETRESEMEE